MKPQLKETMAVGRPSEDCFWIASQSGCADIITRPGANAFCRLHGSFFPIFFLPNSQKAFAFVEYGTRRCLSSSDRGVGANQDIWHPRCLPSKTFATQDNGQWSHLAIKTLLSLFFDDVYYNHIVYSIQRLLRLCKCSCFS